MPSLYTGQEKRNIVIYVIGIMFYKFGLEAFNGSITTLATDRFDQQNPDTKFTMVGILTGLNQLSQCIGSILIAPLIKKYPTRSVLSCAVLGFGLLTVILLVVDAATGGKIKTDNTKHYGNYNPVAIFPVYCATGVVYGMVELIRRVIPRDIVGGHVGKLRRMDAMVHIWYEVAGTSGAFASAALIRKLGNNYSFIITPVCFVAAAIAWRFVSSSFDVKQRHSANKEQSDAVSEVITIAETERGLTGYFVSIGRGFKNFGHAVWLGGYLTLSSRKYCWLIPGYAWALVAHRYLESNIGNIYSKQILQESSYQQIIIGGSNFGELLGAATVFLLSNKIPTPIPFIRLDAILLLITWYLPFFRPEPHKLVEAFKIAATFAPISFGWAAGDVSLAAYIQSTLARVESSSSSVSSLGAVMSFLYVTYISTYAIISPTLNLYVDKMIARGQVHESLIYIGGIHFTVIAIIIMAATFIPKGALSLNPKLLHEEVLDVDVIEHEMYQEQTASGILRGGVHHPDAMSSVPSFTQDPYEKAPASSTSDGTNGKLSYSRYGQF